MHSRPVKARGHCRHHTLPPRGILRVFTRLHPLVSQWSPWSIIHHLLFSSAWGLLFFMLWFVHFQTNWGVSYHWHSVCGPGPSTDNLSSSVQLMGYKWSKSFAPLHIHWSKSSLIVDFLGPSTSWLAPSSPYWLLKLPYHTPSPCGILYVPDSLFFMTFSSYFSNNSKY